MSNPDSDRDASNSSRQRPQDSYAARFLAGGHRVLAWSLARDCALCDAPCGDSQVCADCAGALPVLPPACPRCAAPSPAAALCGACIAHPPAFDRTVAVWSYAFPLDRLVLALKFHARLSLAPFFAQGLAASLVAQTAEFDAIVPMPLHRGRIAERGFNQALEIARPLARALRRPLLARGVERTRATAAQTELDPDGRRRNVRGAFRCGPGFAGRRIAVLDDVMTTGSTLEEFARVLKRAGVLEVTNLVVARTVQR